jgi:hypothetical protein
VRERETGTTARLLYHCGQFQGVEYFDHAVADGQHEARAKLPKFSAGIYQRGRVWQKIELRHHLKEGVFPVVNHI